MIMFDHVSMFCEIVRLCVRWYVSGGFVSEWFDVFGLNPDSVHLHLLPSVDLQSPIHVELSPFHSSTRHEIVNLSLVYTHDWWVWLIPISDHTFCEEINSCSISTDVEIVS